MDTTKQGTSIVENELTPRPGLLILIGSIAALVLLSAFGIQCIRLIERTQHDGLWGTLLVLTLLLILTFITILSGLTIVQPNTSSVVTLFGTYIGTIKKDGLGWVNPFSKRIAVSLRTRNKTTQTIKVNDIRGNPIEIAGVIVWRVVDTARASFDVDDYVSFVDTQCESALRHLASTYPYDTIHDNELSLRGSTDEVSKSLMREVQERVLKAGVVIEETRLSHLAYAPEIAGAMLRRQQADAVISARARIVEGAVTMVESALEHLEKGGKVQLDNDKKAAMVSNLMVVLCGDHSAQPVVNTGTLYQG